MRYNYDRIVDNLFIIFGTKKYAFCYGGVVTKILYSILKILFPSVKKLPINGLEWSYEYEDQLIQRQYQNLNFDEFAINLEENNMLRENESEPTPSAEAETQSHPDPQNEQK